MSNVKLNNYTESERVRIELIRYETPDDIHPIEASWRNLARKLLQDVETLEQCLKKHSCPRATYPNENLCSYCFMPKDQELPRKFPQAFTPSN